MGIFVIRGYHPAKTSTTRTCPAGSLHYVLRHCWATWLGSVGARSSGRYLQESSLNHLGDEAPTRDWQDNEITLAQADTPQSNLRTWERGTRRRLAQSGGFLRRWAVP